MRPSMADGEHMQRFAQGVVVVCGLDDLSHKRRSIFVLGQLCLLRLLRIIDIIPTGVLVICGLDTRGAHPDGLVAHLLRGDGAAVKKGEDAAAVDKTVDIREAGLTVRNLKVGAENAGVVRSLVRERGLRLAPCPVRAHDEVESLLDAIGEMEIQVLVDISNPSAPVNRFRGQGLQQDQA